jgi:hypothetical protein
MTKLSGGWPTLGVAESIGICQRQSPQPPIGKAEGSTASTAHPEMASFPARNDPFHAVIVLSQFTLRHSISPAQHGGAAAAISHGPKPKKRASCAMNMFSSTLASFLVVYGVFPNGFA